MRSILNKGFAALSAFWLIPHVYDWMANHPAIHLHQTLAPPEVVPAILTIVPVYFAASALGLTCELIFTALLTVTLHVGHSLKYLLWPPTASAQDNSPL